MAARPDGRAQERAGSLTIAGLAVERDGKPVLRGVDLVIPAGTVTTLLGANGAGKSELVLAVGGLLPVTAGSVMVDGQELVGLRPEAVRAAGVAIVPEGRKVLRELTVADNLRVSTFAQKPAAAKEGIARALELFPELQRRWKVLTGSLSGGEQQMVTLAQAVSSAPSYLLVDELSLGLAPVVVKRLVPVLTRLADQGIGVLLIEQFAHVALGVADTAYVMEGGRISYHGPTAVLREDPEILRSAYLTRG